MILYIKQNMIALSVVIGLMPSYIRSYRHHEG